MKNAIIIISDPKSGEEALARALNGLALALECRREGDEVEVSFIGTGTRWPAELAKLDHPGNGIFNQVRESVVGASGACAAIFDATESLVENAVELVGDNPLPGTQGTLSVRRYLADDWKTTIF